MKIFITTENAAGTNSKMPAGFTLIEILLVAAVCGLLAGVACWFTVGGYKRMLVEKTAKDVFFAAKYARILAIEKQSPYRLLFNVKENFFCLSSGETGSDAQEMISDQYTKPRMMDGEVQFEKIEISPTFRVDDEQESDSGEKMIVFNPDGTADTAIIQIGDGKNHYTVYLSAGSGRAEVCFGEAKEVRKKIIDLDEYE